jgi:hypothetical protein
VRNAEEVAESGAGIVANPLKYRADAEYDEEKGAENDDFHWLTPAEFVDAYKQSKYYARTISELEKMTGGSSSSSQASSRLSDSDAVEHNEKQYARSSAKQFLLLAKRAFTKEWRDMTTNRSRVMSAILISLITGTLFLRLGNHQVRVVRVVCCVEAKLNRAARLMNVCRMTLVPSWV